MKMEWDHLPAGGALNAASSRALFGSQLGSKRLPSESGTLPSVITWELPSDSPGGLIHLYSAFGNVVLSALLSLYISTALRQILTGHGMTSQKPLVDWQRYGLASVKQILEVYGVTAGSVLSCKRTLQRQVSN